MVQSTSDVIQEDETRRVVNGIIIERGSGTEIETHTTEDENRTIYNPVSARPIGTVPAAETQAQAFASAEAAQVEATSATQAVAAEATQVEGETALAEVAAEATQVEGEAAAAEATSATQAVATSKTRSIRPTPKVRSMAKPDLKSKTTDDIKDQTAPLAKRPPQRSLSITSRVPLPPSKYTTIGRSQIKPRVTRTQETSLEPTIAPPISEPATPPAPPTVAEPATPPASPTIAAPVTPPAPPTVAAPIAPVAPLAIPPIKLKKHRQTLGRYTNNTRTFNKNTNAALSFILGFDPNKKKEKENKEFKLAEAALAAQAAEDEAAAKLAEEAEEQTRIYELAKRLRERSQTDVPLGRNDLERTVTQRQIEPQRSPPLGRNELQPEVLDLDLDPVEIAKVYQLSVDDIKKQKKEERDVKLLEERKITGIKIKEARDRLKKAVADTERSEHFKQILLNRAVQKYNSFLNEKIGKFNEKLTEYVTLLSSIVSIFKTNVHKELQMRPMYTIPILVGAPYHTDTVDSIPDTLFYYIKHSISIEYYISTVVHLDKTLHELSKETDPNTMNYAENSLLGINQKIVDVYAELDRKLKTISIDAPPKHNKDYIEKIVNKLTIQNQRINPDIFNISSIKHWYNQLVKQYQLNRDIEQEKQTMHQLLKNPPTSGKEQGVFRIMEFINLSLTRGVSLPPVTERKGRFVLEPKEPSQEVIAPIRLSLTESKNRNLTRRVINQTRPATPNPKPKHIPFNSSLYGRGSPLNRQVSNPLISKSVSLND